LPSDSEPRRSRAFVDGGAKLIVSSDRGDELYDLATDGAEQRNLAPSRAARVGELKQHLIRLDF
jgi:hypothetical protein